MVASACVRDHPETEQNALSNAGCAGTSPEKACVALQFSVDPAVRSVVTAPLRGTLHWGLYEGGDVTLAGPGANTSVYGGAVPDVDLVAPDSNRTVLLPDAAPGSYQVLAYFDLTGASAETALPGDPVTLPSGAVDVPAGELTTITVSFDFIR
jgi:hypothetical protein